MLAELGHWIGRVADRQSSILIFAAATMVCFGLVDYAADWLMLSLEVRPEIHAGAQATVIGLVSGITALVLLTARRKRRRMIHDELVRMAELNHRLRNSFQILMYEHHLPPTAEHNQVVCETVKSMDEALRELFPALDADLRSEARRPGATAGALHPRQRSA